MVITTLEKWYADRLGKSTVHHSSATHCFDRIFEVLVLAEKLYAHTEHSIGLVIFIFRQTPRLRVKYISYFEAVFRKEKKSTTRGSAPSVTIVYENDLGSSATASCLTTRK